MIHSAPKSDSSEAAFDQVHVLFQRACSHYGQQLALECGEHHITYDELRDRVNAIRALLLAEQLGPGKIVAVYGERSVDVIASAIAVWSIGAMLMLVDATLPAQRRNLMLTSVSTNAVVLCGVAFEVDGIPIIDLRLAQQVTSNVEFENCSGDHAYIAFTSGSTGQPKAIVGSHNGLAHFLTWQGQEFVIGPGDRFAHFTNLSFDVWFRDVFTPLISGATVCIPTDQSLSGQAVFDFLRDSRITATHLVPSISNLWINTYFPATPITGLTHAFFAGEPLEGVLVRKWQRAFPNCEVVNLYGPTETTLAKHYKRITAEVAEGVQAIGWNIPGSMTYLVSEDGLVCETGQTGEICIATPYCSHGYLAKGELVSPFVAGLLPEVTTLPLYRTGDFGRRNQNNEIEILGRKDDQIKINGVRIEVLEVKSMLASHPAVRDVFVCVRQTRFTKVLVAFIESDVRSEAMFMSFLRSHFPAVMIPSQLHLRDSLPRLPSGKIDRKSLTEYANRASPALQVVPQLLACSTAEQIQKIWVDLLDHPNLLHSQNFFDVGGNSLSIVVLHERVEKQFNLKIPLVRFFQDTTVEAQAQLINGLLRSSAEADTHAINTASTQRQRRSRMIGARTRLKN